jgi:hypothetical protein
MALKVWRANLFLQVESARATDRRLRGLGLQSSADLPADRITNHDLIEMLLPVR